MPRADYVYNVYIQLPGNIGTDIWTQIGHECKGIREALVAVNDFAFFNRDSVPLIPRDREQHNVYLNEWIRIARNNLSGEEAEKMFKKFSNIPIKFVASKEILV